jgi:tripartite-type tricarboxylate transporter receptor subunit TctC
METTPYNRVRIRFDQLQVGCVTATTVSFDRREDQMGDTMKRSRRQFLRLAASAAALQSVSRIANAQTYPTRSVRVIVGFPAGGPTDIMARLMGQWLSDRLGQQFVIENRSGAGSNIGTETVVNAPPDGYTLLFATSAGPVNAAIYDKLNFSFIRDIAPVASVSTIPLVVEVHPSVPAKNLSEFIAYAKANSGQINYATAGAGTSPHVAGELFKSMAGVNMIHVPYRGSAPALTDLLGGQVQVMFDPITSSIEHIRNGKLRALAVTTAARSDALPGVPTVGEFLRGYEASYWCGIGAPRNTPREVIEKVNKEVNAGLADAKMRARFADLGATMLENSPSGFGKFIGDETEKWAKVVKFAGIKPE